MIKIYCLVDPRTKIPFYVGSTKRHLINRLYGHIGDSAGIHVINGMYNLGHHKRLHIQRILKCGLKPEIHLLCIVSPDITDICEKYFYNYFVSQGIDLLKSISRFNYQKQKLKNFNKNN